MLNRRIHPRYEIIKPLGSGAFGKTYLAKNLELLDQPTCVIKQLSPQSNDPALIRTAKALFDREVATLRRLGKHDRIPQILDNFEANQEFYLVQEYIEGETLREELNHQKHWDENQAISFLKEILQILGFIHKQGIIHRDIKPENIIRRSQDQKLFLIDFGAVKQISLSTSEQTSSTIIHSRGYTPPEQLAGIPELNSDIYALGMTCIEALTNVKPESLTQLRNAGTQEITWSNTIRVSPAFKSILDRMVCIDSQKRYSSVKEAIQDLDALEQAGVAPDITSNYTPTEVVAFCGDSSEQPGNLPLYTPTDLKLSDRTDNGLDKNLEDSESLLGDVATLKSSDPQLGKQLNFDQLFQELNESLKNRQTPPRFEKIICITSQLFKRKLILLSGLIVITGIGLPLLFIFPYKTKNLTNQLYRHPGSANTEAVRETKQLASFEEQSDYRDHTSSIKFLNFASDGRTLISASEKGLVKVRDLSNQSVKVLTQTRSKILAIAGSADGETLAIATEDKLIEIWNLRKHEKINQISTNQLTWSLALVRDGQGLAEGGLSIVRLWKGIQTKPKQFGKSQFLDQSPEPIKSIAFSPAADVLAAGSGDGTVKLSSLTASKSQSFHNHSKAVNSMAIDANGAVLFTGSEDDTIRIWNLYALSEHSQPVIQADLGGIKTVASSPTGQTIAAGGAYGTVKVWDWRLGQLLASFSNHSMDVTALAFSPDGRTLAVGDGEGRIVIYTSN